MHYLRAYRFVFARPGGAMTWLVIAFGEMVPILGHIVVTGYALGMTDRSRDKDWGLPVFDLDRTGLYLTRGAWPLAVQLAFVLPVLLLCWVTGFGLIAAVADDQGPSAVRLVVAVLLPVSFLVVLLLSVALVPVTLHVGHRQYVDFPAARGFAWDFLHRVGRETVLAQVFIGVTGLALTVLVTGLVCLPVLPFFAALPRPLVPLLVSVLLALAVAPPLALAHLAQFHLMGQLYRLYLRRGGAPVNPFRPLAAASA